MHNPPENNRPSTEDDFLYFYDGLSVTTVQPEGTPFVPVTFHVAFTFFTKVPVAATPFTQLDV